VRWRRLLLTRLPVHSRDQAFVSGLEMRRSCEGCAAGLTPADTAYICSYECTFCPACRAELKGVCPNCGGELLPRPRRTERLSHHRS